MKVIIKKDYKSLSKEVAKILKKEINNNPNLVLGLATGSTPMGLYEELIKMNKKKEVDFSNVTTFNLDEYVGLCTDHKNSYNYFMYDTLFNHINIKPENVHIPDGVAKNLYKQCVQYDNLIDLNGGIDVQILGIGTNGHIAFNEPDLELNLHTSVVELAEATLKANSRFFENKDEVPTHAISMGMGSILKAKKIILMASGSTKKRIMKKLLNMKTINTEIPASILLLHPDVTIIMDKETT